MDNDERHATHGITPTLPESDGAAVLTVTDDGPGIPSGLGLAITRDIVERHGGTVEIDVTHTAGARFVVRLPKAP